MGVFKTVAIVILSISFIVFIALFGRLPAFRRTPIGFLHRLLLRHIPNGLSKVDGVLTGGCVFRSVSSTFHYLMHEKHPTVLIFFVGLQVAGEVLILPTIYPTLSLFHQLIIPPLVILPYYYLYLCATISSSIPINAHPYLDNTPDYPTQPRSPPPASSLHPSHHSALTAYPYDHLLFHPGYFCSTCQHPKPARSKHCSLCRACIQRQDHHCIWINNCVGRNNHLYFFLLLVSITLLLAYGSFLGYWHLTSLLTARFAPTSLLKGSSSAKTTQLAWRKRFSWTELMNAYIWAFTRSPSVGATTLLTIMCTPLAAGFLIYHVYLLYIGATTNETAKWSDWREDIDDGLVWRARMTDLRSGEHAYTPLPEHVEPRSEEVDWPPGEIPRWLWRPRGNGKGRQGYRPEYWYIHTRNGDPPTIKLRDRQVIDDTRWERVRSLRREVDNVYDLGFWGNLWEVIFHRERNTQRRDVGCR